MTEYDNTNRWTLNKNAAKADPKHSDYKGKVNIDGKLYWIDGWIKDGANGKFISGTVKAAVAKPDPISSGPQRNDDMNDDIPF